MGRIPSSGNTPETESEKLFAAYLDLHGYGGWLFEPTIEGKRKHPDFLAKHNNQGLFFEVKERTGHSHAPGNRTVDPMRGIREEIQEARKKFRAFKEYACSLVIFNVDDDETRLLPFWVYGAMLGDPGFALQMDLDHGRIYPEWARAVFTSQGGQMRHFTDTMDQAGRRRKTGRWQNTTINAVIILERRRLAVKRPTHKRTVVRVRVCEHPGPPRNHLPRTMFRGPYDERWAMAGGMCTRIWRGSQVGKLQPESFGGRLTEEESVERGVC